ncbi:alcohol dehydrogenase protein [Rutstroemia sp. NJR-2017a BBW]|nr:alcohol dehydrogenase protein [Rutstroemia sp. NJR-2017a BBW]
MSNVASWLLSQEAHVQVAPSDMPKPQSGEIVIRNQAVPLHPGDWKLAKGIIPIPLKYPTVLGNYTAGYVHDIGTGVTRFQVGDRVLSMSAFAVRGDHRYGAHQRFVLASEMHTAHIGSTSFEAATSAISVYAAMSALVLHLNLDRPSLEAIPKNESVLIWGGSSTLGFYAVQIASQAGYRVITTASESSKAELEGAGAFMVYNYHSPEILESLRSMGPYKAIFAANDSASDQVIIGKVVESQGGGQFLTSMGLRPGIVLPSGYMDDYFKLENEGFTKWVFWEYLEGALKSGRLKLGKVDVIGGIGHIQIALDQLQSGSVRGKKLVINPNLD